MKIHFGMPFRTARLIVIAVILCIGLAIWQYPFLLPPLQYLRFMHRSHSYYANVAHACDSVFREHPVSSNDVIRFTSTIVATYRIRLSGKDPALPKAIKQLHADWVMVGSNF